MNFNNSISPEHAEGLCGTSYMEGETEKMDEQMMDLTEIIEEILRFQEELAQAPKPSKTVDRASFTLLLSGISTCRKLPGVPEHMGYETLYHCKAEEEISLAREHLRKMYGIRDLETLKEAMLREFSDCEQYEQFRTFWVGAPMFRIEEIRPENREWFLVSKAMARQFYPIVKERGFYAWDINEKIGLCRKAAACGIISEEEFWELTDPYVRAAQVFYHSWQEYAISCLCGAVYFMRREEGELMHFLKLNMGLVRRLFEDGMAWQENRWYQPKEREWAALFDTSQKCLITKKALEEERIGYMYRQAPEEDFSDCGWRFLTGDETEDYVKEPDHILIRTFSEICNIAPSVRAYFYAGYGMQYVRTKEGWAEIE